MRINYRVVIDISSGEVVARDAVNYDGPLAKADDFLKTAAPYFGLKAENANVENFVKGATPYISMAAEGAKGVSGFVAAGRNADAAKAEGRQAIMASQEEAARVRRQVAQQQSRVRALSGGDLSGSSLEILLENAKQGELMAQDRLYAGRLTELAKKRQAANFKSEGMFGLAGSAASIAGLAAKQFGK